MSNNYGANRYKKTAVGTASKTDILLMLYEAAIRNVKKASDCIQQGDMSGKGAAIGKAHDIVNELGNSLNFDVGGDVAHDLERLYNFMTERLLKANLENSREDLETVEKLLSNLLEGWKGAIAQLNGKGAP